MTRYANLAGVELGDEHPVRLLGVINVSPESFYAGSVASDATALRDRAQRMVAEGADLIDVGAMSTAPYKQTILDEEEEVRRLGVGVAAVRKAVAVPISADTSRAAAARAALDSGAQVLNDVTGLRGDPAMGELAARRAAGVIIMATPTGSEAPPPLPAVRTRLAESLHLVWRVGMPSHRVVLDPGIGFFRNAGMPWHEWDCEVLRRLGELADLGHPIAVGVSRKSFLGKLTDHSAPEERLPASLAATAVAIVNGAHAIRTHDVAATRDAVRVAEALRLKFP